MVSKSFVGVWGSVAETASVSLGQSDVSVNSPRLSPGVFNFPVITNDTDKEHTVVQRSLAVVENSRFVGWPVGSINSNSNGSSSQSWGQIVAVLADVSVSWNLEGTRILEAVPFSTFVFILFLLNDSLSLDVFEGIVHKTTIAGLVSEWSWAVNELLLWEALKISIGLFAKSLKSSSGGESPAWTTAALVLYGGNDTLGGPINISNADSGFHFNGFLFNVFNGVGDDGSEIGLDEFFLGQGRELVKTHIVGSFLLRVVSIDVSKVSKEDSFSVGFFKLWGELHSKLVLPSLEFWDFGGWLVSQKDASSTDDGKENCNLFCVHEWL